MKNRPDLIDCWTAPALEPIEGDRPKTDLRSFVIYGLLIAFALALFVSPFASTWPDGLDRVSEKLGFSERAVAPIRSPLADYRFPGFKSAAVATALAGFVGTLVVFVLSLVYSKVLIARTGLSDGPTEIGENTTN